MTVVVRTHGGLGNQLFQILYARLESGQKGAGVAEIHDIGYAHKFTRSDELTRAGLVPNWWQRIVSGFRIPKVLERLGLMRNERMDFLGDRFLDGYFQRADQYTRFAPDVIAREIDRIRNELRIDPKAAQDSRSLYHIRLGDFFENSESAFAHALERIEGLDPGSVIITNQEALFAEPQIAARMTAVDCSLQPTAEYSGEQVVRLMASFARIITNDSTLALWASVLGNSQTAFENVRLAELHRFLFEIANP